MNTVSDRTCIRKEADAEKLNRLKKSALGNDHLVALATYMSAAGNETRLRMLNVLWQAGELCVCDLADIFEITQPAVSRHLKILREKALVESRRDAQTIYSRVCRGNPFARMLVRLFDEQEAERITLNLNEMP
jgi:ArsR family transcriptional regulator, lead/cadmium/zinc/bismuth-responsive transcriptional repressor